MRSPIDRDQLRRDAVQAILERGSGHVMSSLSVSDIIAAAVDWWHAAGESSADLVLSKGHAAPALYAALAQTAPGKIPFDGASLRRLDSPFEGHPHAHAIPGVIVSTGSLGIGLAFAVGRALGRLRAGPPANVVVVVSDGELQEGLAWEALHIAARFAVSNLLVIVDANEWQTSGPISRSDSFAGAMGLSGIAPLELDGHDAAAIAALLTGWGDLPRIAIAHTSRTRYLPSFDRPDEVYGDRVSADVRARLVADLGIADLT